MKKPNTTKTQKTSAISENCSRQKTFLVKFGLRTNNPFDRAAYRDNFSLGLIEAVTAGEAQKIAMESHCPEAFEEDVDGEWTDVCTDTGEHSAFQLGSDHCVVDQHTSFWIDQVTEVPESEVQVLEKYL